MRITVLGINADGRESFWKEFRTHIVNKASQQQAAQMPAGESETETDAMVNIPGVGVKVVPKDSEEYQKATQGIDGYGLAESA